MKHSSKITIIIATVLLLIGSVLSAAGFGLGGMAAAEDIISSGDFTVFTGKEDDGFYFGIDAESNDHSSDYNESFSTDDVTSLKLDVAAACVNITDTVGDNNIQISVENLSYDSSCNRGTLEIKVKGKPSVDGNITISIPRGYEFDSVEFKVAAAEFNIDSLVGHTITIENGAGDITIGELISDQSVDLNVGTGNLAIYSANIRNLSSKCAAGNMDFNGIVSSRLDVNCSMGNVNLALIDSMDEHDLDLSAALGTININNGEIEANSSKYETNNGKASLYRVKCAMGKIDISFEQD